MSDLNSDDLNPDVDQVEEGEAPEIEKQKLALNVEVNSPSTCQRHVMVTIGRADIDRYFAEAIDDMVPKAEVPGFRIGKAPRKLVASRFREQVREQVKGSLLMDSMQQVTEEQSFSAISEPDFNYAVVELPDDGDLTFEFDIEVRPEFELPEWKNLNLNRPTREISDDEVDSQLERILQRFSKTVTVDRGARLGDRLSASIQVAHEGKSITELEELNFEVRRVLSFQDGELESFGELIEGAAAGQQRRAKVVIGDSAEREELRGKEVDLTITVEEVREQTRPALTSSFLDEIGGFESEQELRNMVREELERQVEYHRQQQIRDQIATQLTSGADWDLPPELLRRQSGRELERAVLELQRSGFNNEQINARANQLKRNVLSHTERALKEHFIFERIAEDLELEADPQDYDQEIALIAQQRDEPERRVRARLEKRGQMDTLRNQIIERKVVDAITEAANFTSVQLEAEDKQESETTSIPLALAGADAEIPEAQHGDAQDLRAPADHS